MLHAASAQRIATLLEDDLDGQAPAPERGGALAPRGRSALALLLRPAFFAILAATLHAGASTGFLAAPAFVPPTRFEARFQESAMRKTPKSFAVATAAVLSVGVAATAQDAVQWRVEDGGNGHWYRTVALAQSLSWDSARTAAQEIGGHLVSITSAAESAFVGNVAREPSAFNSFVGPWLGGFQDRSDSSYFEPLGGWKWVTGEPWYSEWQGDEPNNGGTGEDYLMYAGTSPRFADLNWNDFGPHFPTQPNSFIVEWSADCNSDGIVDFGQIRAGELDDANGNNIPDCCEGFLASWGDNSQGQSSPPALGGVVTAISAGYDHSVCLLTDGTVRAWGYNAFGQCDVPNDLGPVISISAGDRFVLALRNDGVVRAWGFNGDGQCDVPPDLAPIVEVAAGGNHSMARLADGTLRCWGNNTDGQCTVPLSLGAVLGFDGGVYHSVAVDASGGVRCWGLNDFGQSIPPVKLASVASVSAGDRHTVALLSDGTVRCWGQDTYGQCSPPSSLPALQEISASDRYSLGLTTNGRVVRWGQEHGTLPGPETECTMIAAGAYHGVAALVQRDCETPCPADITGNGAVDGVDLAAILGAWGGVGGGKSGADVNRDGSVDAADLAAVLGAWGPCP